MLQELTIDSFLVISHSPWSSFRMPVGDLQIFLPNGYKLHDFVYLVLEAAVYLQFKIRQEEWDRN